MRTFDYKEAIDEAAECKIDGEDCHLEMRIDNNYYYVFSDYDGKLEIYKSTFDLLLATERVIYGGEKADPRCPELEKQFEKDVEQRVKDLKEASRWRNYEDTFTTNDWHMQTVGFTHYAL